MAAVNPTLFSWDAVEAHSDLERLRLALDYLPDQHIMTTIWPPVIRLPLA